MATRNLNLPKWPALYFYFLGGQKQAFMEESDMMSQVVTVQFEYGMFV